MSALPTGTVTFLFTDIEGSTKLAQQYPDAMPALLARHHAILSQTIQAHDGYVFQIIGDSFHAAFYTVRDALQAAVEAQRLLVHEPWHPAAVKVRMGINTGGAQAGVLDERAGGYAGYLTLTRAERVMSAAHGSQIFLSNASAELVRGELPPGVTLRDMQEHRLKGLSEPERIWQVDAPDLPHAFPPLESLTAIPHNLPVQLTSFVGRANELAEIKRLLTTAHLLTLTGSGGTGKTRLALRTGAEVLDAFADGVWFIELAPISDPELVPQAVATTIGVPELLGHSTLDLLLEHLRGRQLLLILDNCEHLIDACARLANQLLRACPRLTILTTSREALGIAGERTYRVPSLSTAALRRTAAYDEIAGNDCVHLFVERAQAVQANFQLTDQSAPAIVQICLRLDGIPLAVELAAARVKVLTPDQIAARLDDRFRLLTGGSRAALPRQQTLRALIDWSYDLLPEAERALLRRLSVFVDGWTYEAAEAVCKGDGIESYEVLDLLTHLADKSLVTVDESEAAGARYRLLETIRQYARDKLLDSGHMSELRDRHLDYFVDFGDSAYANFFRAHQAEWSRRVRAEEDNVRAALEWGLERHPEAALRLAGDLSPYWSRSGYAGEGLHWVQRGLEQTAALPPADGASARERQLVRARGQLGASTILVTLGDFNAEREYAEASLETWQKYTVRRELALALINFGVGTQFLGDNATALASVNEAVAILRQADEPWALAYTLGSAALALGGADDVEGTAKARSYLQEGIGILQTLGDETGLAYLLWTLGRLEYISGNYAEAKAVSEASLASYAAAGFRPQANAVRSELANAEWRLGQYDAALTLYREAIAEWRQIGNAGAIARCLECVAFVWLQAESPALWERAAQLLGAAEKLRETIHATMTLSEQKEYKEQLAQLRAQLDGARLQAAWASGRALATEQAIAVVSDKA